MLPSHLPTRSPFAGDGNLSTMVGIEAGRDFRFDSSQVSRAPTEVSHLSAFSTSTLTLSAALSQASSVALPAAQAAECWPSATTSFPDHPSTAKSNLGSSGRNSCRGRRSTSEPQRLPHRTLQPSGIAGSSSCLPAASSYDEAPNGSRWADAATSSRPASHRRGGGLGRRSRSASKGCPLEDTLEIHSAAGSSCALPSVLFAGTSASLSAVSGISALDHCGSVADGRGSGSPSRLAGPDQERERTSARDLPSSKGDLLDALVRDSLSNHGGPEHTAPVSPSRPWSGSRPRPSSQHRQQQQQQQQQQQSLTPLTPLTPTLQRSATSSTGNFPRCSRSPSPRIATPTEGAVAPRTDGATAPRPAVLRSSTFRSIGRAICTPSL